MQRSKIFYIHTHGLKEKFYIDTDSRWLTMSDLEDVFLNQTDFVFLLTCYTAQDDYDPSRVAANEPINVVEQLVCCGVNTVIGFKNITEVADCNKFAKEVTKWMCVSGLTVEEAVEEASDPNNYLGNIGRYCLYRRR